MFIQYDGKEIKCVTDTQPEGPHLEVSGITPEDLLNFYEVVDGVLVDTRIIPNRDNLRVAVISSYGINCGIATYAKYLCDQLKEMVDEVRIFAEEGGPEEEGVVRCWKRETQDTSQVLSAVAAYNPDVVYIQHEYGCFSDVSSWNTLVGHLSAKYRTLVVLHSVYEHFDKLRFEAPCAEIIVHTLSGRELLKSRGVDHCKIHYVPHGCLPIQPLQKSYTPKQGHHTLFQYGFGFEYKGWDNVIEIVDVLRKKLDVTYVGVFNISKFSEDFSNYYYKKLMAKICDRGLQNHIVLHKGFRSEQILLSYMMHSSVNIFPYWNHPEWRVHGASGAIRLALASGTPTIVGDVPFFSEFKGHIPVCENTGDYVRELTQLFTDEQYREEIKASTRKFIEDRTWGKVASAYLQCLETQGEFTYEG